jgi:hypothetical protein
MFAMLLTEFDVVEAMRRYGGSFVQALAVCWQRADIVNRHRLEDAFPDIWAEYQRLAERAYHERVNTPDDPPGAAAADHGGTVIETANAGRNAETGNISRLIRLTPRLSP